MCNNNFEEWCKNNGCEDYLNLWDYEANKCSPKDVTKSTTKKFWFKCPMEQHSSNDYMISNLTNPKITSKVKCKGCNSFVQWLKDNDMINLFIMSEGFEIDKIQKSSKVKIKMKCDECKQQYNTTCNSFFNGKRCPICSGKKVIKGINDVNTTHPWITQYLKNIEDGWKVSYSSRREVNFICTHCRKEIVKRMCDFNHKANLCDCFKVKSFPNRYVGEFLREVGIKFQSEKRFAWSDNKIYDFYIEEKNIIIEVHGGQHYENGFDSCGGRNCIQERQNDIFKRENANTNGMNHYFEIDARKSKGEWIKKSLCESGLLELLKIKEEEVPWNTIEENTYSKTIKTASELWEEGKTIAEISDSFILSQITIKRYLKIGSELGWTSYNPKEQYYLGVRKKNKNGKQVKILKDGEDLGTFNSCMEIENISKEKFGIELFGKNISKVCLGQRKTYKGYTFLYV